VNTAELNAAGVWVSRRCLRFFADAKVHQFGASNLRKLPSSCEPRVSGVAIKEGAHITFSVAGDAGTVDYEGHIDGDTLHLRCLRRATGRSSDELYKWTYVDWNVTPAEAPVQATHAGGKRQAALPFPVVPPRSMTTSEAARWYVLMLARLPRMLESAQGDAEKVALARRIKSDIRDTAARSMVAPEMKKEFFAKMPLPSLEDLLRQEPAAALATLLTVTHAEVCAFPAVIGDACDIEHWDGQQWWLMTERGWTHM
jgi:hypothetical protein